MRKNRSDHYKLSIIKLGKSNAPTHYNELDYWQYDQHADSVEVHIFD